jgi:hypothetical protein
VGTSPVFHDDHLRPCGKTAAGDDISTNGADGILPMHCSANIGARSMWEQATALDLGAMSRIDTKPRGESHAPHPDYCCRVFGASGVGILTCGRSYVVSIRTISS